MIIITERNRDGAKIWIDVNHILQSNKPYVLKYARLIYHSWDDDDYWESILDKVVYKREIDKSICGKFLK